MSKYEYEQGKLTIPEYENVPEAFHDMLLGTVTGLPLGREKTRRFRAATVIPVAAALILLTGGTAFAAKSLYDQRMETISKERLSEYYASILAGGTIHYNRTLTEMVFGSSESTVFYEWDTSLDNGTVYSVAEAEDGSVYATILVRASVANEGGGYDLTGSRLLHISADGVLMQAKDMGKELLTCLAIDDDRNIYAEASRDFMDSDAIIYRFDTNLNETARYELDILSSAMSGMCVGRDGAIYLLTRENQVHHNAANAIYKVDMTDGSSTVIGERILPEKAPYFNLLRPGKNSDFVIWGDAGVYSYDIGDDKAKVQKASYELPVDAMSHATLYDEKYMIFMKTYSGNESGPIPQDTYFYYVPILKVG